MTDPLTFVREALALMPDPADVSGDDLGQLTAIGQGLAAHLDALAADTERLALAVVRGERGAEAEAECRWHIARRERCEQAQRQLKAFTYAAIRARGINPDRLAGH